jgi:hypothetical protein
VETKKSKSLRWWYLTPKSSTTNAKTMSRETWRKRQRVEVWWKPWEARWESRRSWDSLPVSFKPYIDAEKEVGFAGGVRFDERGKLKAGEDRVGEKVGGDFDKLGLEKGSIEVVVGQVN